MIRYYISTISIPRYDNFEILETCYENMEEAVSRFINLLLSKYNYEFNYGDFEIFYFPFLLYPLSEGMNEIENDFFDDLYIKREYRSYVYDVCFKLKDGRLSHAIIGKAFLDNEVWDL